MTTKAESPLKIGYLMQSHNPDMSVVTGPQAHVKSVVQNLKGCGHQVRMVATQNNKIQVTDDLRTWQPGQFLRSNSWPVLITQWMVQGIQGRLRLPWFHLFSSYRFSDACVTALNGFDVLYERYGFLAYGGVFASKRLNIPIVLEVNGDIVEDYERRGIKLSRAQWALAHRITRWTYNNASHVVTVDEAIKERIIQRWGIDPDHITVIRNGTEYDLFSAQHDPAQVRRKFGLPAGPLVAFVGGFKPWHGADVLTKAFGLVQAQIPDATLVLIGEGPEREKTTQLARELRLDGRIIFTGRLPQSEVAELLSIASINTAPYRLDQWRELAGLKLFDYLACGKAIVASARNMRHPVIKHMETGFLVEPSNEEKLAEALLILLKDDALRRKLGENAQNLSRNNYTWEHTVAKIEDLCRRLIEVHPLGAR